MEFPEVRIFREAPPVNFMAPAFQRCGTKSFEYKFLPGGPEFLFKFSAPYIMIDGCQRNRHKNIELGFSRPPFIEFDGARVCDPLDKLPGGAPWLIPGGEITESVRPLGKVFQIEAIYSRERKTLRFGLDELVKLRTIRLPAEAGGNSNRPGGRGLIQIMNSEVEFRVNSNHESRAQSSELGPFRVTNSAGSAIGANNRVPRPSPNYARNRQPKNEAHR